MSEAVHRLPGLSRPFPQSPALSRVARALRAAGGRGVIVGGAVRDHLLGQAPKDVDVEVYQLSLAALQRALEGAGQVHAVGRSFGVLKVVVEDGAGGRDTLDVSLPRTESKVGQGHRGFVVESDPFMPFEDAAARRDFTLNAMGIDLERAALLDPHGGARDLEAGVLRHVSPAFDEDPLRVLRACQFAARFALGIAPDTLARCRALEEELASLPEERLWEELKKLLRARWPSIGLWALVHTGALSLFPELAALRGCPQEPEWHPEGDVWVHTLMVTDEAAGLVRRDGLEDDEALLVVLGALCHDLGKPPTTEASEGRIRSINHESAGEAPTRSFLARVGAPAHVVEAVVPLVRDHLKPFQLYLDKERVSDGALRRLALRVPIGRLVRVARADFLGRTTKEALCDDDPASPWLLAEAERLQVAAAAPRPLLLGRHLLERGVRPGKHMGPMLERAFEAQLEGDFATLEDGLTWLDEHLGELSP
jgi:tRNA nucleotidyltransferase (CCA-adding enzyme)